MAPLWGPSLDLISAGTTETTPPFGSPDYRRSVCLDVQKQEVLVFFGVPPAVTTWPIGCNNPVGQAYD